MPEFITSEGKEYLNYSIFKFDPEVLKNSFPKDVMPNKKEEYITEEQFRDIFKMERQDFRNLKDWKKKEIKRKVGFF